MAKVTINVTKLPRFNAEKLERKLEEADIEFQVKKVGKGIKKKTIIEGRGEGFSYKITIIGKGYMCQYEIEAPLNNMEELQEMPIYEILKSYKDPCWVLSETANEHDTPSLINRPKILGKRPPTWGPKWD